MGGASLVVQAVKNPPGNTGDVRDTGSITGLGRSPGGGAWQPPPVFLPGESRTVSRIQYPPPESRGDW